MFLLCYTHLYVNNVSLSFSAGFFFVQLFYFIDFYSLDEVDMQKMLLPKNMNTCAMPPLEL